MSSYKLKLALLEPDHCYHIFNRANGGGRLFYKQKHFAYFLAQYFKYASGFWQTYAYCLLPDHFHFLIRVNHREVVIENAPDHNSPFNVQFLKWIDAGNFMPAGMSPVQAVNEDELVRSLFASWVVKERFRCLFLGFTKAVNRDLMRKGSLFERPYKRKRVEEEALAQLILYIHRNPVHHGFAERAASYHWSSYRHLQTGSHRVLQADQVHSFFGGAANMKRLHALDVMEWQDSGNKTSIPRDPRPERTSNIMFSYIRALNMSALETLGLRSHK